MKYTIDRNDAELFEEMEEDFLEALQEGTEEGITRYKIVLEPVFEGKPDKTSKRASGQNHSTSRASF